MQVQKLDGIDSMANAVGPLFNSLSIASYGCAVSADGSKMIISNQTAGGYSYGNPILNSMTPVVWQSTVQGVSITPDGSRGVIGYWGNNLYHFTWSGSAPTIGTTVANTSGLLIRATAITYDGSRIAIISNGTQQYADWNTTTSSYNSAVTFGNIQNAASGDITNDGQTIFFTCETSNFVYMSRWTGSTFSAPSVVFTAPSPIQSIILLKPKQSTMIICCKNGYMYYTYYNGSYSLYNPNFYQVPTTITSAATTVISNCWNMCNDNNGNLYLGTGAWSGAGYFYNFYITYSGISYQYINKYVPMLSQATTNITNATNSLQNGTYTISSSYDDYTATFASYRAFAWGDGGSRFYWAANGHSTTTVVDGTTYTGEWLQIKLPNYLNMTYFETACVFNSAKSIVIAGSTDGSTWTLVYNITDTGLTSTNNDTIVQPMFSYNISGNNHYFNYFRFIITQRVSSQYNLGRVNFSGNVSTYYL